jgi:hypothetical protein
MGVRCDVPGDPSIDAATEKRHNLSPLSRAREAFARRDWMGIVIELIVVTLGILLAFRVEQWGQQRNRNIEELQFLERLYRENARSVREMRDVYDLHRTKVTQLGTAIRSMDNPDALRLLAGREGYGCWQMQMPAATYNSTSSEELISSGRLNLVSSSQLRLQLRELAAAQAEDAALLGYRRDITQVEAPYLHPYYRLSLGPGPEPICFIDWPSLARDPKAITAIVHTYRAHARLEQSRKILLRKAEDAQHSLACALHKTECAS